MDGVVKDKRTSAQKHLDYSLYFKALGLTPVKEYKFCPTRKWKADLVFHEHRIIVEVEGGLWRYGRHNRPQSMIADMEKYNMATRMGWRVFRFTPDQVKNGEAAAYIWMVIRESKEVKSE